MEYKCPRCNYETYTKCVFLKHIQRKIICKSINGDISLKDICDKYIVHECSNCFEKFQSLIQLNKHLKNECTQSNVIIEKHNIMNDKTTQTDSSIIEDLQKQLNIKTNIINNIINLCNLENTMLKEINEDQKNIKEINEDNIGYIYIIMLREHIKTGESIYKIGHTHDFAKRIVQYPPGSATLFVSQVADRIKCEQDIIARLKGTHMRRFDIGNEYFEGAIESIMREVIECVYNVGKPTTLKAWRNRNIGAIKDS